MSNNEQKPHAWERKKFLEDMDWAKVLFIKEVELGSLISIPGMKKAQLDMDVLGQLRMNMDHQRDSVYWFAKKEDRPELERKVSDDWEEIRKARRFYLKVMRFDMGILLTKQKVSKIGRRQD